MSDYIKWIRSKVGNDTIILNFASTCIVNESGKILLQKRSEKEELWGLPGGAIEIGESIEEAAIREVKEVRYIDSNVSWANFDSSSIRSLYEGVPKIQESIADSVASALADGGVSKEVVTGK